jgi:outer membrane receptor for ferrienterochelin and colicin
MVARLNLSHGALNAYAVAIGLAVALAWGSPAHAQAAAADTTSGAESSSGALTEVVVTATRRQELIKDIPMSVTAITGADLEERAALNLADFIEQVPGVMLVNRGAGANEITIRGLNANATQISSYQSSTVGY